MVNAFPLFSYQPVVWEERGPVEVWRLR